MKYIIASDIHGSAFYAEVIKEIFLKEKGDKLILLGDIYNPGPRNPLPKEYSPMKVAEIFNELKYKLFVVKGNCDSDVDEMISEFDFISDALLTTGNKTVFLTHGHVFNKDNMPKSDYDAVIYGHKHIPFIEDISGVIVANCGSVSLPKKESPRTYIVLEDEVLTLKDIDGTVLKEQRI